MNLSFWLSTIISHTNNPSPEHTHMFYEVTQRNVDFNMSIYVWRVETEVADCCLSVCLPLLLYCMLMHMNAALCLPLCPLPVPHMLLPCAPLIQQVGAWLSLTCHQITHTKFTCIPQLSSCCRFVTKNKSWSSWLSRSGMSAASLIGRDG